MDHLHQRFVGQSETAILFVYIDYKDQETQLVANLIGSLLRQIVRSKNVISTELMMLYEKHLEKRTRASVDELCSVLCSEIRTFTRVFVLVDAMDEFNEKIGDRAPLVTQLTRVMQQHQIRLMITSRHNADIEKTFPSAVSVEIRASDEDVRKYLESRIQGVSSSTFRVKLDSQLQHAIVENVANNVRGM